MLKLTKDEILKLVDCQELKDIESAGSFEDVYALFEQKQKLLQKGKELVVERAISADSLLKLGLEVNVLTEVIAYRHLRLIEKYMEFGFVKGVPFCSQIVWAKTTADEFQKDAELKGFIIWKILDSTPILLMSSRQASVLNTLMQNNLVKKHIKKSK